MGGMTLNSASSTGTGEQGIKDMDKNPDVETEEGRVDKKEAAASYQNKVSNYKLCYCRTQIVIYSE